MCACACVCVCGGLPVSLSLSLSVLCVTGEEASDSHRLHAKLHMRDACKAAATLCVRMHAEEAAAAGAFHCRRGVPMRAAAHHFDCQVDGAIKEAPRAGQSDLRLEMSYREVGDGKVGANGQAVGGVDRKPHHRGERRAVHVHRDTRVWCEKGLVAFPLDVHLDLGSAAVE